MRLGVDIGGSKIEVMALDASGAARLRRREPTPQVAYAEALQKLAFQILAAERELGERCSVGIGMPGTLRADGLVHNAYATPYSGNPLKRYLEALLQREVRFE